MADPLDPQTWGDVQVVTPRTAAVRTPPASPAVAEPTPEPIVMGDAPKMFAFDPNTRRLSELARDPVVTAVQNLWRDRQAQGRQAYEAMLKHPEVGSSFKGWLDFIVANQPYAKPRARKATDKQKEISDFANHLLSRIPWSEFVHGPIQNGFAYGFSLSNITSQVVLWRDRDYISLGEVLVLPQASLDNGYISREEFGQVSLSNDPRYHCFDTDNQGRVRKVIQFHRTGSQLNRIEWQGRELESILHYIHRKGDGNLFGQSMLYEAFYAWSDLYVLEKIESVFLDMALPVLIISYKTQDGITRPALHAQILDILSKQEISGARRVLVLPDTSAQSIAPSNENFTAHIGEKKAELRKYIRKAIGMPEPILAETTETDADARNIVEVFHKSILRARLAEIGALLEDLISRFVRANYRDLDAEDYPVVQWSLVTDNEVRVAQAILAQVIPHLDATRYPDAMARIFRFLEPDDFAATFESSVASKFPGTSKDPASVGSQPPQKEPGSTRQRLDKQTDTPSSRKTST